MIRSGLFWADTFERVFIPEIEAIAECLERRILPSFASLEEEADRLEQEEYERLGASAGSESDVSEAAEYAQDTALSYYQMVSGVRQGVLNMFAAMCYHLFEQQLLRFHRDELLSPKEKDNLKLWKNLLEESKQGLMKHGIDITSFTVWAKMDEFRLVANVVKHAEGSSAEKLRKRIPELFIRPDPFAWSIIGRQERPGRWLYQPLMGEDFYVTRQIFRTYKNAALGFWKELAVALRGQQPGNLRTGPPPRHSALKEEGGRQ